jgi:hypothetical protein
MNCATQQCKQGRDRCSTPWTCGKYSQEAAYERALYIHLDEPFDEPPVTAEGVQSDFGSTFMWVCIGLFIGCAIGAAIFGVSS